MSSFTYKTWSALFIKEASSSVPQTKHMKSTKRQGSKSGERITVNKNLQGEFIWKKKINW